MKLGSLLEDKVAVITGGAQGLGQAISHRLAAEGCRLLIADINEPAVKAAAAELAPSGESRVIGLKSDVTQEAEVKELFTQAQRHFGRVDVVVANAAVLIAEPIAEADAEKWRAVMNVNLFGYFLTTRRAPQAGAGTRRELRRAEQPGLVRGRLHRRRRAAGRRAPARQGQLDRALCDGRGPGDGASDLRGLPGPDGGGGGHTLLELGGPLGRTPGPLSQALELPGLREDQQRQHRDAHQGGDRGDRPYLGERV